MMYIPVPYNFFLRKSFLFNSVTRPARRMSTVNWFWGREWGDGTLEKESKQNKKLNNDNNETNK